ncbi:MAG: S28 family serine protease, partial [Longimicrobiales bacterium]
MVGSRLGKVLEASPRPPLSLFLLQALLLVSACSDATGPDPWDRGDILDRLNALPGVVAVEIEPYYGYPRAFQLDITQPVDHNRPNGPSFTQRAYLSHVADSISMVFAPSGYGTTPQSGQELAEILQANCLSVTHRYFPEARPGNPDWRYLDIWQAAQDHHRIVTLFKEIYDGKWVSTGASKGGKTAVFHRRFFPDDVDATVAYVAPFLLSPEDARFEPYLRTRGTPEEREAIYAFQRMLLE